MKPSVRLLLLLAVTLPLAVPFAWHWSATFGLLTLAATFGVHAPLLYGTLHPNNQIFGPVVTRFTPTRPDLAAPPPASSPLTHVPSPAPPISRPASHHPPPATHNSFPPVEIWLTIDDGPDPHDTPRLLDLLAAADARATFFVRGDRVRAHPELIREILQRGHTLGNHTDTHPQAAFWCLGPRRLAREIDGCQAALLTTISASSRFSADLQPRPPADIHTRFVRAPVGMVNPFVHPAARARGLTVVGWSARGFDGVSGFDPAEAVRRILADLRPGGIVLLHEGKRGPRGDAPNVRTLKLLLEALRERGWRAILPPVEALLP